MKHDGNLTIATGHNVNSRIWHTKDIEWSELVEKLSKERRTSESYKDFIKASKSDQLHIKGGGGGYVGGYLREGRRKPENVVYRQLLTLDIDFAHVQLWDDLILSFRNAAVLHSTHKHCKEEPRFRLIMPLDREVSPDEYVAIARQVAGTIGIDLFDNTTFETNRLMFWPSCPKDAEYYFKSQDAPWLNADEILASYTDWTDSSLWPTADREATKIGISLKKQQDPHEKEGIVGSFCRCYSIQEAIETYLAEEYSPATEGRYTYTKGSTAAGLVIYEDKYAYSHHGTDPTSGLLCNAFDLVRVHRFGHLDRNQTEIGSKSKSFKAMQDLARGDEKVKLLIARENLEAAKYDFKEQPDTSEEALEWVKDLEVDSKGKYLSTANNINLIFKYDPKLKGVFKQNDFDNKKYIFKNVPWRDIRKPEPVKNVDYSGVRNYIESIYGISGVVKIEDALNLEFERHSFHPIREYLEGITWDGIKRLDTLLIDYYGVRDNLYSREASRKTLVAAVARVFEPGVKYDTVLTLVGAQGTGKSTLVEKLGRGWSSDTFTTVHGKEAFEQLQGAWLIEMAELAGLRKAEVENIKHFITKQVDTFRPAYGRTAETFPRQCIFIATTNKRDFLRDPSGNRRFLPVDVEPSRATKDIFKITDEEINQLWAEAMHLYKKGEKLYMTKKAEKMASVEQKAHSETDERAGIIEIYLEKPLPKDWEAMDILDRRAYYEADGKPPRGASVRDYVCVAEIWCECLGHSKENMDRYKTRELNDILRGLDGWVQSTSTKNFKHYGKQKYYYRDLF